MNERPFIELLDRAQKGEEYALDLIIEAYMPLIAKYSYVGNAFDEDCRQFLLMRLLIAIRKFRI